MSATSFALALLLRSDERKKLLPLLWDERRLEVESALEKLSAISVEQIHEEFKRRRADEYRTQKEVAVKRVSLSFDHISPKLATWLSRPF
jgi:hypothetical protein